MPGVAVIGMGRMGAAMARRLCGTGHRVTVFNRTRAKAEAVAADTGAVAAVSAREAVKDADVVLVSLADDAAVLESYDDIAAGLRGGTVVLETSTIHPRTVRAVAQRISARSAVLLDAPVSGSVPLVERGELTVMVGGPAEALGRAQPVLHALAQSVFHLGGLGAGATMKLAVNAVVHGLNLALAEALVLAERAGVDRAQAYSVFTASAAGAPFVRYKRDAFLAPESTPVAFSLELVAKDLELITSLAAEAGNRMDQLTATHAVVQRALAAGYGDRDMSALAELLRSGDVGR